LGEDERMTRRKQSSGLSQRQEVKNNIRVPSLFSREWDEIVRAGPLRIPGFKNTLSLLGGILQRYRAACKGGVHLQFCASGLLDLREECHL